MNYNYACKNIHLPTLICTNLGTLCACIVGRVPKKQPKVCLDRQRYPDDPEFTGAFTVAEHDDGINALKNVKVAGLEDIQTELIKHMGPKARNWLRHFCNNCTQGKKMPIKAGADTRQWFNQWPRNAAAAANSADLQMRHQKLFTLARHLSVGHFSK